MTSIIMHYDLRAPDGGVPVEELYDAALEQCAWADGLGLNTVTLSCHHGVEDNYCPSEITFAAAAAARTKGIGFNVLVTVPFYHPVQLAEELTVLDIISRGRANLVGVLGYRDSEYDMFDIDRSHRGRLMEEHIATLRDAWTGNRFERNGRDVLVRPRPVSPGGPKIIFGGDSRGAAHRAARIADGYMAMPSFEPGSVATETGVVLAKRSSRSFDWYQEACRELGTVPHSTLGQRIPCMYLHVAKDPKKVAKQVEPYLLHVANSYAQWMADGGVVATYQPATSVEELLATGNFQIVTPEQCCDIASRCEEIMFDPLYGGIPPEIAWEGLRLFEEEVLPRIEVEPQSGAVVYPVTT